MNLSKEECWAPEVDKLSVMGSCLYQSIKKVTLALILALPITVYYGQVHKGIGQRKPPQVRGLLAANLFILVYWAMLQGGQIRVDESSWQYQ